MSECERFAQVTQDKWMSDCERIAQVAHDKWSNVRDSLRSLRTNERLARFFEKIAHFLLRSQKMSSSLKKIRKNRISCMFFTVFFEVFKKANYSLIPSQVAQDKWATVRSLRRNERSWTNHSGRLPTVREWANRSLFEQIAHLLTFLNQKMSDSLRNSMS